MRSCVAVVEGSRQGAGECRGTAGGGEGWWFVKCFFGADSGIESRLSYVMVSVVVVEVVMFYGANTIPESLKHCDLTPEMKRIKVS